MNICVINGSPKGEYSVTLQTVRYLEKRFPACRFTVLHAGQRIRAFEKDMAPAVEAITAADLVLFCYPVYTFLAPAQLHRFIELLKGCGVALDGRYAAQITTSKHFYDVTAHRYIEENCRDLSLRYIGGLSADMEDLLAEAGRADADAFWRYVLHCAEAGIWQDTATDPAPFCYAGLGAAPPAGKLPCFDTVLVTDRQPGDEALGRMIRDFAAAYPYPLREVNLADFPFAGGCLGCFRCAGDGKCVYTDGFDRLLREQIQAADATVYAFTVRDHSMGARFKLYDDRQFCNGHRTVTMGKPVGYLAAGQLAHEANLRMVLEGRAEVGGNFLAGIAHSPDSIRQMAARLAYALENRLQLPQNFYGVGGMKIFRDLIWLMRGLMKADHVFYRQHGFYDFPQRRRGQMLKMQLLGAAVRNPGIREKMGGRLNEGMVAPYRKVVDAAGPAGR